MNMDFRYLGKLLVAFLVLEIIYMPFWLTGHPFIGAIIVMAGAIFLANRHVVRCTECNSWQTRVVRKDHDAEHGLIHAVFHRACASCKAKRYLRSELVKEDRGTLSSG